MISFVGDHTEEIIHLKNKMSIIIDFGSKKRNDFGLKRMFSKEIFETAYKHVENQKM